MKSFLLPILLVLAVPECGFADGIGPQLAVDIDGATFVGQCSGAPCTETLNISFDISAIDSANAVTTPLTNVVIDASGFLGQFTSSGVAELDKGYIGFYDAGGDEIDLFNWTTPYYSGSGVLALYDCQSVACMDDFSSNPVFGGYPPNWNDYRAWSIQSVSGTITVTPVPEPSALVLLSFGLLGLAFCGLKWTMAWTRSSRPAASFAG